MLETAQSFVGFADGCVELGSSIHRQFRQSHEGHKPHAGLDATRASTGVVWTSEQAYKHGFLEHPEEWANLGQGAPEVDDSIEGCFERPREVDISAHGREYGPTAGIRPLREAVATLYNEHHRKWRKSQYTWENVGRGCSNVSFDRSLTVSRSALSLVDALV